jgi:hypothetical protein
MARPGTVIGWKLDSTQREALLAQFPAKFERVVADHVTLRTDAANEPLPAAVGAAIVGRSDDGSGVEALVVAIDGDTARPDGSTFHITWSLAEGRRARESNTLLKERGWDDLDPPVAITIEPARF